MVMGQDLCSDNPLFQGSMVGGLDVDALAPKAPEMDFDLGLDDAGEAAPDLDLSLDDEPLELPEMGEGDTAEEESEDDDETLVAPAGELEFDLSDAGAVDEAVAEEDEFSLDIDASELDIDIQDEVEEEAIDLSDEIQDVGDIDIDFGLDDEATTDEAVAEETPAEEVVEEEEVEIDLTEEADALNLDMDDVSDITEEAAPAPVTDDFADEEDFDLSSLDDVDEVSTKLDLARAYLDMGDHEGTRGILEEVIAEGNDEQKKEANELMAQLD